MGGSMQMGTRNDDRVSGTLYYRLSCFLIISYSALNYVSPRERFSIYWYIDQCSNGIQIWHVSTEIRSLFRRYLHLPGSEIESDK